MPYVLPGEEVLTIQLIENLQWREIDPIDKTNAILAFFRNRHGEMDPETVFSTLVTYDRDPERVGKLRCLSEPFFAFADVEQLGKGQDLCPAPSAFPQYRDDTRLFKLPQHVHDHGQARHARAGLQQRTCEDRLIKQAVQKRNGATEPRDPGDRSDNISPSFQGTAIDLRVPAEVVSGKRSTSGLATP